MAILNRTFSLLLERASDGTSGKRQVTILWWARLISFENSRLFLSPSLIAESNQGISFEIAGDRGCSGDENRDECSQRFRMISQRRIIRLLVD